MAERVWIKPAPGMRVCDPFDFREMPPEGKEVEMSSHWMRRVKDGDCEVVSQAVKPAKKME